MNRKRYTASVVAVSLIIGLAAGITVNTDILETGSDRQTHQHALFFIEVNKTPIDLREDRFMLQDEEVHLENNRSRIVHKHAEGVTWKRFLQTVNISVKQQNNSTCITLPEKQHCGQTEITLNGEEFEEDEEIQQGDKLAIVQGNNSEERAEAYMEYDLPSEYRKSTPEQRV